MKKHRIRGKKGGVTTVFLEFGSYIVFVMIVIIFYILFTARAKDIRENKITDLEISTKADITLLNYLKTPIEATIDEEKRQMTMADIIVLSDVKHKEELERGKLALEKSHEILDKNVGENKWAVNVCYPRDRLSDQKCWLYLNENRWLSTVKGSDGNLAGESSIIIPDLEKDGIKVTMRILK